MTLLREAIEEAIEAIEGSFFVNLPKGMTDTWLGMNRLGKANAKLRQAREKLATQLSALPPDNVISELPGYFISEEAYNKLIRLQSATRFVRDTDAKANASVAYEDLVSVTSYLHEDIDHIIKSAAYVAKAAP